MKTTSTGTRTTTKMTRSGSSVRGLEFLRRRRDSYRSRSAVSVAAVLVAGILGWSHAASAQIGALEFEARVVLEQDDHASSGERYLANYLHRATVTLRRTTLKSEIDDTAWEGSEICSEPPLDIAWKSEIDFDPFDFEEPEVGVLVRDGKVWILYHPAREFGVIHPGRPPCDSGDGILRGAMVAKSFYHGDLEEGANPIGDLPVAVYDEDEAFGGFVVAVVSLDQLESGVSRAFDAHYRFSDQGFSIGMAIQMKVTPQ